MRLRSKIAWITGAGSGIGKSAAIALAKEGASVVLSGRREAPLREVASAITADGGTAEVKAADLADASAASRIAAEIRARFGRLDILVNNAGVNIARRSWKELDASGADQVLYGNLSNAFYCVLAALPIMRAQKDGVLIHTASIAGRIVGGFPGPIYSAAKHGVVAMSHSINMQEGINGIRSTVFLPGEVATPILDKRPNPVGPEERARMVQSEDCGDLIRYIACLPKHLVMSEVMLAPAHNRTYIANLQQKL